MSEIYSKYLEEAVENLSNLPGIGRRSAMRLSLWLLKQDEQKSLALSESLKNLKEKVKYCKICHNLSDDDICGICGSGKRDPSILCVVADVRDVMAIENTAYFKGLYHVLGGIISPIEGIGAKDLEIDSLAERIHNSEIPVEEVILALPATLDGNTTQLYLQKRLQDFYVKITAIARGVAVGDDLEYTDEMTLITSLRNRVEIRLG